MFKQLSTLFRQIMHDGTDGSAVDTSTINLAMASLLCEVANADHDNDPREQSAKVHLLVNLLDINESKAKNLLEKARHHSQQSVSLYEFTTKLRSLEPGQRFALIEAMWQVAYADGVLDPHEEAVIRQAAELIYLDHSEFIRAKLSAQKQQKHG